MNHVREARNSARARIAGLAWLLLCICGQAVGGFEWVERPDAMHWHMLADYDELDGKVRILYQTMPSLQQGKRPDAAINVYIAELFPDGRIENRRLTTGQRRFASLLLRRGHDQVFALRQEANDGGESVPMETWSTADGSVVSSFTAPALTRAASTQWPLIATGDGNFLLTDLSVIGSRGDQPSKLSWTKYAPDGAVLGTGEWFNPTARVAVSGAFPARNGGVGLMLRLALAGDAEALQSDIDPDIGFEVGGRQIEARIYSETRMLEIGAGGHVDWVSPALQRDLMWEGEVAIPHDLPVNEIMAQNAEQMERTEQLTLEYGGQRRLTQYEHIGFDEVRLTPEGYGLVANVSANRKLDPPRHGPWFIEIGANGSILREAYLQPAAERLDAKFDRFMPTSDGSLLVAGPRQDHGSYNHLTALGPNGDIEWTVRLAAENVKLEGIAGSKKTPWVFGHGFNEAGNKNLMWVERVDPSLAGSMPAVAEEQEKTVDRKPDPRAESAAAEFTMPEMPEPAEGCACSCEEYEEIQALTERLKTASQADQIALISDPETQAKMNCMAGCMMQYMECR